MTFPVPAPCGAAVHAKMYVLLTLTPTHLTLTPLSKRAAHCLGVRLPCHLLLGGLYLRNQCSPARPGGSGTLKLKGLATLEYRYIFAALFKEMGD